jgi:hypothetical protein
MPEFEEYSELEGTGHESKEPVKPEDEFYHSVYISGQSRKNHLGVTEEIGKFQIRGVEYNLDQVNMIITHTKDVLTKENQSGGRTNVECFSFKPSVPPWYGTSRMPSGDPRQCPQTSAERAVNDYCNPCRSQIIVGGIYCKADGSPILSEENKPIFLFIRGKGMKYSNVSNYLGDLFKMDLSPIFTPVTEQSQKFERKVVNNKRFVTNITKGTAESRYGIKDVFVLKTAQELPQEVVLKILDASKKTLDKFNEKFDWSKRASAATGYEQKAPEGEKVLTLDEDNTPVDDKPAEQSVATEAPKEEAAEKPKQVFSFDDVNFDD